jgi:hypothetical protein
MRMFRSRIANVICVTLFVARAIPAVAQEPVTVLNTTGETISPEINSTTFEPLPRLRIETKHVFLSQRSNVRVNAGEVKSSICYGGAQLLLLTETARGLAAFCFLVQGPTLQAYPFQPKGWALTLPEPQPRSQFSLVNAVILNAADRPATLTLSSPAGSVVAKRSMGPQSILFARLELCAFCKVGITVDEREACGVRIVPPQQPIFVGALSGPPLECEMKRVK